MDTTTIASAVNRSQLPAGAGDTSSPRQPWIYAPWVDLLIGCGAWSAPLLLVAAYVGSSRAAEWSFAFYFLALLFNYPHFMATAYRAYHSYGEFTKYRFYTVHVALLLACAGLIAHLWYPALPWIFSLYIYWSPWHYTGQNYGLLMMFARRAGATPTENERLALRLSFIASYALLLFSFNTGPSGDALVLSLGLPAAVTVPARLVLAAFFIGASGWGLISLSRRSSWKALLPSAILVSTQFLWFLLPALIELLSGKEVPQTRYSSGILAVLHSAQYLWIASYYQQKEARAAGKTSWSFARYLLTLVAGGIALFIPGPWIVSRVFHADFATSFLTFTALVNLHHFLLDGALWKLRDSRIAQFLLNKRDNPAEAQASAKSSLGRAGSWLAGTSAGARGVRIAAVVLLLVWGGVDQLHFYWAHASASLASLQRAAKLNPDDSAVQLRLAQAAHAAGDNELALAAMRHAAEVNPGNASLQESYARELITAGRGAEAYALYQSVLQRIPRDVDALVNYGLLAHNMGHDDEAIDSWQRAVDVDPGQANAQLYLAQFLEQRGENQAAARHYRAYLGIVAKHPSEHAGETATVLSALTKVADADSSSGRNREALKGYELAIGFARKMNDPAMQSLALAHSAEALEKAGKTRDAARSFQAALQIDANSTDSQSAAVDWLNYGQFLQRQKQPEGIAFACYLKAEDLLRTNPGAALSTVVKVREEAEARLGSKAPEVRAHMSQFLLEAMTLPESTFAP